MELANITKICFKNETYDLDGVSVEEFLGELGIEEGTVDMEIVNDTLYINAKAGTKGVLTEKDLQEKIREKVGNTRVAVEFKNGRLVPKETAKSESLREHVVAIKTHLAEIEKLISDGNNSQHIVSDNDNDDEEYEDALD